MPAVFETRGGSVSCPLPTPSELRQRQSGEIQDGDASTGSCCSHARTLKSAHLIPVSPAAHSRDHGALHRTWRPRQDCVMQRESNQAAAGEVCGRVRTNCARKTLCDAGMRPYPVRTTLRACVTLSRGIPLIPLNPAESRLKIKFCPRWDGKPDRDRGETCGLEGAEGGAEALGGVAEDAQVV